MHAELSEAVVETFFRHVEIAQATAIHSFISMKHTGEVETASLFTRIWNDHPDVLTYAPRVDDATGEIDSIEFRPGTTLTESRWKIAEPSEGKPADPFKMDIVIVPLVCFDRRGYRVGYGKGYYDRFLRNCRPDCLKAGLSFFLPVDQIDDVHDGDIPLDLVVTPEKVVRRDAGSADLV